jgi:hypothetical protein
VFSSRRREENNYQAVTLAGSFIKTLACSEPHGHPFKAEVTTPASRVFVRVRHRSMG